MSDNTKRLIGYGSVGIVLGAGFIVVSGITAVLSKLLIIGGIFSTGYGIYKIITPDTTNNIVA